MPESITGNTFKIGSWVISLHNILAIVSTSCSISVHYSSGKTIHILRHEEYIDQNTFELECDALIRAFDRLKPEKQSQDSTKW